MTLIGSGLSSEVFLDGPETVLKLYREPSEPAAIENEFRATSLARAHGFPVARPIEILRRDGRTGILFERLEGRTVLRHYARNPLGLMMALRRLAVTHAAIHATVAEGLPSQHARLATEIGWARVPDSTRAATLAVLERLPRGDRLCHGDIHPGNVLCTSAGLRIIDWQKASAGNPAGDVARTRLMIRYGRLGRIPAAARPAVRAARGFASTWYGLCYRSASNVTAAEMDAWDLPLMVARLCARRRDMDAEILGIVDRLLRRLPA